MEKHALSVVNQGPIDPGSVPEAPGHTTEERSNHDPPELALPLPESRRTLSPLDEQVSAELQSASTLKTDHVRSETVACDASGLEETRALSVSTTGKSQVVAKMVEHAFAICEGGNCKPLTRMLVANLLQFLSKQYEEEKSVAMVEIARLKEQSKLVAESLQNSVSELERITSQNQELRNRTPHTLEHQNLNPSMRQAILVLQNQNEQILNELLALYRAVQPFYEQPSFETDEVAEADDCGEGQENGIAKERDT